MLLCMPMHSGSGPGGIFSHTRSVCIHIGVCNDLFLFVGRQRLESVCSIKITLISGLLAKISRVTQKRPRIFSMYLCTIRVDTMCKMPEPRNFELVSIGSPVYNRLQVAEFLSWIIVWAVMCSWAGISVCCSLFVACAFEFWSKGGDWSLEFVSFSVNIAQIFLAQN